MDRKASWQAFGLILLVSLLSSLWWVLHSNSPIILQLSLVASGLVAWMIFAGWVSFLDMLFKGGGMSRTEILRVGGFATLPLVFLSIPYAGWLSVIWFWRIMYAALRSLYSTKPLYTLALIGSGSLMAMIAWGYGYLLVNTVLSSILRITVVVRALTGQGFALASRAILTTRTYTGRQPSLHGHAWTSSCVLKQLIVLLVEKMLAEADAAGIRS
jgi:hypothetical protein